MKQLITLFISISFIFTSFSQTKAEVQLIDSLKQIVTTTKDDSIKIRRYIEWDNLIYTFDTETDLEINSEIYKIAITNINKLETSRDSFFCKMASNALNTSGTIYIDMAGKQNLAIESLESSIKYAKRINDQAHIAQIHNNLGIIQSKNENLDNSLNHYTLSKKILEKIGDEIEDKTISIAVTGNIGYLYFEKSKLENENGNPKLSQTYADSAIIVLNENILACDKLKQEKTIQRYKATALNSLSNYYNSINDYKLAKDYSKQAIAISENIQDLFSLAHSYQKYGAIFYSTKNYQKSIENCKKGWVYASKVGASEEMKSASNTLYLAYKYTGQPIKALTYYEHYISIRDSINSETNQKAAIVQVFRFEYEKQAEQDSLKYIHTAHLKNTEIEKHKLELINQKTQKTDLIIFILLIFGFAIYLALTLKDKQRKSHIILTQNNQLERQRKKFLDSITYAENIQKSILPELKEIQKYIPGFSILFEPKDIVSGDFYWFHQDQNISYIALSDFTGHGVPGAFMSMIGTSQLKEIIIDSKEVNLGHVLDRLDTGILNLLKQHNQDASEDGMDLAILKIDHLNNTLEFAGAHQNLFLVKDDIVTVKGTLRSIGGWVRKRSRLPEFSTHTIELADVKAIYLTTDGFEDKFGGEDQTKFGRLRVLNLIREMGSTPNMDLFKTEFIKWKKETEQIDDISIIGIKLQR